METETALLAAVIMICLVGITNYVVLYCTRNPVFKRRYLNIVTAGSLLAIVPLWFLAKGRALDTLSVVVLSVLLPAIVIVHIKSYRFCRRCGATNYNPMIGLQPMRFCKECGEPLGA